LSTKKPSLFELGFVLHRPFLIHSTTGRKCESEWLIFEFALSTKIMKHGTGDDADNRSG
jgi:hypothetical protein